MSLRVLSETVSPFAENTFFVFDDETKAAIIVDPGDEADRLFGVVEEHGLNVERILLTHGHIDHVGAVPAMRRRTGAEVWMHPGDEFLLDGLKAQAELLGLRPPEEQPVIDHALAEGDVFPFAGGEIRVFETPGHSPGSVTLDFGELLVAGDVLFAGSIGRTDLPGGDHDQLLKTIRERLFVYPDKTIVYPGHGPSTTIGREKRQNPFFAV
jgi:glyoxylase-like metal-dependent hydrolase (beta-lactamase superfamily II)